MSQIDRAALEFLVQFMHPERTHASLPGLSEVSEADAFKVVAPMFGMTPAAYTELRKKFADNARRAAQELVADPTTAARIDKLPFSKGQTVVGFGDSITDDAQSWLEILRVMFEIRRPRDGVKFVNAAVSGDSSMHLLVRFVGVAELKPDWIICFVGTNDARMHGPSPQRTLVSIAEFEQNLKLLRDMGRRMVPSASWVWITPGTVIPEKIASHVVLSPMQLSWRNSDLTAFANVMKRQAAEPVVELQPIFGMPPKEEYLIDDGLHPSLEGQKVILKALIEKLAR